MQGVTKNEVQRRPSALLRAMSPSTLLRTVSLSNGLSNGKWTFYEAVIETLKKENKTPYSKYIIPYLRNGWLLGKMILSYEEDFP